MPQVPTAMDLASPLHTVTFCVVDLETTGGSPADCTITEVGAAKFQGGECLGTFQTLVNPGCAIPPFITQLTGISEAMVLPAPPVREILPALLEFVGGAVLVGHNVRFDLSFLDAALVALDRDRLGLPTVDTVALARRLLLDDDVADCRLATLATRFGLAHRPTHRALDDVLATADLLHLLLEQAAPLGVTELDDLLALPAVARHRHAAKLRLTARLPRAPGVYLFRDGQGRPIYAGAAADLRTRVRSLFAVRAGPRLRTLGPVLRAAQSLDHLVCASRFEAAVAATRVVHALEPRFNAASGRWRGYRYVRPGGGRVPRATVTRTVPLDGAGAAGWLGPVSSTGAARRLAAAVQCAVDGVDPGRGPGLTERMRRAVEGDRDALLAPLRARWRVVADAGEDGDAAGVAEHAAVLDAALGRQARLDALRWVDRVVLELPDGTGAELRRGRLVRAWPASPEGGSACGADHDVLAGAAHQGFGECSHASRWEHGRDGQTITGTSRTATGQVDVNGDGGRGRTSNGRTSTSASGAAGRVDVDGDDLQPQGKWEGRASTVVSGVAGRVGVDGGDLARAASVDPACMALPPSPGDGPVPVQLVDELACVQWWLERWAPQVLAELLGDAGGRRTGRGTADGTTESTAGNGRDRAAEAGRGPPLAGLRCLAC